MGKLIKFLLKALVVVLIFAVVAVLALPLWIGPVATGVANVAVPKITGTGFNLGAFGLNPYVGKLHVGDMQLQNPERFFTSSRKEAKEGEGLLDTATRIAGNAVSAVGDAVASSETNAVSLAAIDVNLAMTSLMSDTIRVEEIVVKDLSVYGDLTFSNIREIVANASGDKSDEKSEEEKPAETKQEAKPEGEEPQEGGKKVVIDRILITGTRIQWGHAAVTLPDIELKDIGKEEPVDEEGAFDTVLNAICDAADKAKTGLGTALKTAVNGGRAVGKFIGDAAGAIGDAAGKTAGAVGDAAGTVAGATVDAANAIGKGAVDKAKAAADAASKGVNAAADALKGMIE